MQSLSILSDVDPADFIRSDAPISQFARASFSSYDRFPADPPEQQQLQPQFPSYADSRLLIGSRPSVLETAQTFGGVSSGIPRQLHQNSNALSSQAPQLSAVLQPAPTNVGNQIPSSHQMQSSQKSTAIKVPSQVLLVFVDGRNGHAVIDRLSYASASTKIPLNTGDRLKCIDGHLLSSAQEAIASIQALNNGSGTDVELDFVTRSGVSLHAVASRQQVGAPFVLSPPPSATHCFSFTVVGF